MSCALSSNPTARQTKAQLQREVDQLKRAGQFGRGAHVSNSTGVEISPVIANAAAVEDQSSSVPPLNLQGATAADNSPLNSGFNTSRSSSWIFNDDEIDGKSTNVLYCTSCSSAVHLRSMRCTKSKHLAGSFVTITPCSP